MKMGFTEIQWEKEGKKLILDYLQLSTGALTTAASFAFFFLPYDIAPGGVTGIATVLASLLPLSVGVLAFVINLPLFLMGVRDVGWRFAFRSFIAMMLLSLFIDLLPHCDLCQNIILASVFGGVVMGVGLGMVVRAGATTGGTDLAAKLVHEKLSFLSVPVILLLIDSLVIACAAIRFGLQAGCYALISCYVSTKAMDLVLKGVNTAMQFMIITRQKERIIQRIHQEMNRGCTELHATGTYSGERVGTLMCVINRVETARLKKIVSEEDPDAFMTVCDVHEVFGEGFTES